jgi:hypothetical protein
MARGNLITSLLVAAAMSACGGNNTPPADSPDDAMADGSGDGSGDVTVDGSGDGSEAAVPDAPKDGIKRDADGDGVPDDTASGCQGRNETQCKINSTCAWTDDGQCVEAKASPM